MDQKITLAHGSGGRLTAELVGKVFVAAFGDPTGSRLEDAAVLPRVDGRLALTTDAFVVKPRVFRGGDIGKLSVCGTVNDLAVMGAEPIALTAAFVIEEGVEVAELGRVAESMAATARDAGVRLVAGDTKVVERGSGDGIYIATAGYGCVLDGLSLGADRIEPGDVILVSGDVGRHEAAVLLARGELHFAAAIESDCAVITPAVRAVLEAGGERVKCLRDATRGGLATVLCEFARSSGRTFHLRQDAISVTAGVEAVCEMLGLDPLYLACEGRFVALVGARAADAVEARLRALDPTASRIGEVGLEREGRVLLETGVGGRRVLDLLTGGQLPRIC